jgi:O-antigen ligase
VARIESSAIGLERPFLRREGVAPVPHSDSYRYARALLLILVAVTLDTTNFLDRGTSARYLLIVIPFMAVVLIRLGRRSTLIRTATAGDRILFLLLLYSLFGSVFGKVVLGTQESALAISMPMTTAFLYLAMTEPPSEAEARSTLKLLAAVGFLYVLLNAAANSGIAPALAASLQYRNSDVIYVALAFGAAINAKQRLRLAILAILGVIIFLGYPSGTTALVGLATVLTLYMTRPKASARRPYRIAMVVLAALAVAIFNFHSTVNLIDKYFQAVHKQNNNPGRIALWSQGLDNFKRSPFFGSAFTGPTTVLTIRRSGLGAPIRAPLHNDYILFLVEGGALGLVLLVSWGAVTEVSALRRYRAFVEAGDEHRAALLRTLLVGFNGYFCAAMFNPLFYGASRSATLFALYSIMMLLGDPREARQPAMSLHLAGAPRRGNRWGLDGR